MLLKKSVFRIAPFCVSLFSPADPTLPVQVASDDSARTALVASPTFRLANSMEAAVLEQEAAAARVVAAAAMDTDAVTDPLAHGPAITSKGGKSDLPTNCWLHPHGDHPERVVSLPGRRGRAKWVATVQYLAMLPKRYPSIRT